MRAYQRALMGGALFVTAILMAQLHLAMNRIQYLDEKIDRVHASLEKQLRQQQAVGALKPIPSMFLNEHMPHVSAAAGGKERNYAKNLGESTTPVHSTKGETIAAVATAENMVRGRAKISTIPIRPRMTPTLRMAPVAAKSSISAAPGCNESPEQEPRVQFEGLMADFGHPVNDRLVRMYAEGAVNAGRQYARWDRWQWKQRCGDKLAHVGARVKQGADRSLIKYVRIWGERNSCTTMVTDILSRNLDLKCDGSASCVSGGLPHKHDFMRGANLHDHAETLNILVTRHPYEWLASMRRHPFYAGSHYDKAMTDFLTQEWASYRLRDLDDKIARKAAVTVHRSSNVTVHLGRPSLVGPCAAAGQLKLGEQCESRERAEWSPQRGGETVAMQCTRIPGLVPATYAADPDGGARMLGPAASTCMNASASLLHCPAHSFLCQRGGALRAWELNSWRQHLEAGLHDRFGMRSLGFSKRRQGKWCYRKAGGTASKVDDKVCDESKPHAADRRNNSKNPADEDLYECVKVPGYEVGQGFELAPSPTCLPGGFAWGVCEEGRFLCRIFSDQIWNAESKRAWHDALMDLKAANKHFQETFGSDTDPGTAMRFPSVAALRTAKLRDWYRVSDEMSFSTHLACRDLYLDPNKHLNKIKDDFGLKLKAQQHGKWDLDGCLLQFGNCDENAAKKWDDPTQAQKRAQYLQGRHMSDFDTTALAIANAWLDPEIEGLLGYRLFDNLPDASKPFDAETRCAHHLPVDARKTMC